MGGPYTSKDYLIKLDDKAIPAYQVQERLHPTQPGRAGGADIILWMKMPADFFLMPGDYKITLVPHDKSKPTISYDVILQSTKDINAPDVVRFLRNGSPT